MEESKEDGRKWREVRCLLNKRAGERLLKHGNEESFDSKTVHM